MTKLIKFFGVSKHDCMYGDTKRVPGFGEWIETAKPETDKTCNDSSAWRLLTPTTNRDLDINTLTSGEKQQFLSSIESVKEFFKIGNSGWRKCKCIQRCRQ